MVLTGYGGRAFDTFLWPVLGFFFMPYATCAYTIGINERGELSGWAMALFIVGILLDFGSTGGGARYRRRYYRVGR
jgi:hypothetical protein